MATPTKDSVSEGRPTVGSETVGSETVGSETVGSETVGRATVSENIASRDIATPPDLTDYGKPETAPSSGAAASDDASGSGDATSDDASGSGDATSDSASGSGAAVSDGAGRSGGAASDGSSVIADSDDDDDWPTRYSWLDDEPDESSADDSGAATLTVESEAVGVVGGLSATEPEHTDNAVSTTTPAAEGSVLSDPDTTTGDVSKSGAEDVSDSGKDVPDAGDVSGTTGAEDIGTDSPQAQPAGARLVAVVPGVPRYHEPGCILIRFMSEDDIQKLSILEAKDAGCTPCAACQPED